MSLPRQPDQVLSARRLRPKNRSRETLLAFGAGLAVMSFVVWAVLSLSSTVASAGGVEGVIVRKEFVAAPETQVTVGRGGVTSREIAGEWILGVRVPDENGKVYRVYVSESEFRLRHEGERYYFVRPGR